VALAVVDANLLIYAFDKADEAHSVARSWLESVLAGSDVLAVPMLAIAALLRASTHHSLDHLPERLEDALGFVDDLIALPNVRVLHTDRAHWTELKRVLDETGVMGRSITDAQFAALTLQHDGTFYTTDKHFRRFPRLRWVNPLTVGR
jgi:toxin-antitoxin system PIN domain toxin